MAETSGHEAEADVAEICRLEGVAASAWPPGVIEDLGGWRLFESGGGTRRAQSVQTTTQAATQTTAGQGGSIGRAIDACERFYADRAAACVFKLTRASEPATLDAELEARGYVRRDETIVQVALVSSVARHTRVTVDSMPSDAWLAVNRALSGRSERDVRSHEGTLRRVAARPGASAFASVVAGGQVGAIGLAAVEDGVCFIGEVVTDPAHRRAGHARAIVESLIGWSSEVGASEALLQVVAGNARARSLYADLGFRDRYRYWYRSRSPDSA